MTKNIYKYFSSEVIDLVFQKEDFCGVKCSLPKDYNDPFELFLGVDTNVPTECLATYQEIVNEIPQLPTTCFSNSPVVTPMWAHYAENHSGFVVEFDVSKLEEAFDGIAIRDVEYRDGPDEAVAKALQRSAVTKKARHAVWLQQAVLSHAYFSKYETWRYEQECRLVDNQAFTEEVHGNSILYIPMNCISAIISGNKSPDSRIEASKAIADANSLNWFATHIGKSNALPFFSDREGNSHVFKDGRIEEADSSCVQCSEPTTEGAECCPWCSITEEHEYEAAIGNPFRIIESYGGLDDYLEAVSKIERSRK